MIKDSGDRTEYNTGAVRDCKEGKGRCDLLPLDVVADYFWNEGEKDSFHVIKCIYSFKIDGDTDYLLTAIRAGINFDGDEKKNHEIILEVSKHFEDGAQKYGENNWQKGIPVHSYIDSAIRHYLKYRAGWTDEPHDRAFVWNLMCCIWTMIHHPELDDWTDKAVEKNK